MIPVSNEIETYLHCSNCLNNLPREESPSSYARLSVGFTRLGIQVWCERCGYNVMHINLEGYKHPANTHRARRQEEDGPKRSS